VKFWLNQFFRQRKLDSYELPDLISQPIRLVPTQAVGGAVAPGSGREGGERGARRERGAVARAPGAAALALAGDRRGEREAVTAS
jgi:hypothetical protein